MGEPGTTYVVSYVEFGICLDRPECEAIQGPSAYDLAYAGEVLQMVEGGDTLAFTNGDVLVFAEDKHIWQERGRFCQRAAKEGKMFVLLANGSEEERAAIVLELTGVKATLFSPK